MTVVRPDFGSRFTIGGSEAAAAVGVDPYRSPVMLWAEKTGRYQRPETDAMRWGKLLEPVVFAQLEREGWDVMPALDVEWQHDSLTWLRGHVDGFVDIDGARGVLEIKTANHWTGREWSSDAGAPLAYLVQVQHYLYLTGLEVALLACLIDGQRLELRTVERDDAALDRILEREDEFLRYVRQDVPPPPDGSKSTDEALKHLFPTAEERTMRLSTAGYDAVKQARLLKSDLENVKTQLAECEQRIKLEMGEATVAVSPFDTLAAKWTSVSQRRFDTTAFKAAHPDLYDEFAVSKPSRRFTLE